MNIDNTTNTTTNIQLVQGQQHRRKKKCYGNRSDQRFRKRCRNQKMSEEQIEQFVNQRINARKTNPPYQAVANRQQMNTTVSNISIGHELPLNENRTTTTINIKSNKRKKDAISKEKTYNVPKSTSTLSVLQPSTKKMKKKNKKRRRRRRQQRTRKMKKIIKNKNYQPSGYLRASSQALMNTLRKHLNHPLKKRNEQKFVYSRLHLFDEEFALDLNRYLWQSYLEIGSQQQQPQIWPNEVYRAAKTNESNLCQQYIVDSLNQSKTYLDLCYAKLNTQAQSWISTLPSLDILDDNLKKFVRQQKKHSSTRINKQLKQYKDVLEEKKSFQQISLYLTPNDRILVDELINLQQLQMQLMEEFAMLEQRIICKLLPQNFDSIDNLIKPPLYTPLLQDVTSIEFKIQHYKIIQQIKRTWLNIYFNAYEKKIQEYEEQYIEKLHNLQLRFECKNNVNRIFHLNSIKTYLHNRKQRTIQQIYIDMSDYRKKLLNYRKRSSKAKKTIDVSPKPIFYLLFNPFNDQERDYLSKGKYRSCVAHLNS
ncbi:unnamed protein product [Adineta steineri]|uniref:Uncharacterized protein n=1 Tax=Adineta steineri TaxID=433720 RepID=A0A815MGP4_9BILA|nr:unnamed protein product [Adineta steineri]CAF1621316.1 unnamed protein product [Adineta steineri]